MLTKCKFNRSNLGLNRYAIGFYYLSSNLRFIPYVKNQKLGFLVDNLKTKERDNYDLECNNLSDLLEFIKDIA